MQNTNQTCERTAEGYTTVYHSLRTELKISPIHYFVLDIITRISRNGKRACYANKENIAKMLGTTRRTVTESVKRLTEKGLIEKGKNPKHLHPTDYWLEKLKGERKKWEDTSHLKREKHLPKKERNFLTKNEKNVIYREDFSHPTNNNKTSKKNNEKHTLKSECEKYPFESFWNMYDKKADRAKCEKVWGKITDTDRAEIFRVLPTYIDSTPNIRFRKNPLTWINGKCWRDEFHLSNNLKSYADTTKQANIYDVAKLDAVTKELMHEGS